VFTDCFGVANSAVEAAFGLSLLAALSLVLDFVPFVGTAKGAIEAFTGKDLLTGEELAPWERALGVLPFVGGAAALAAVARRLDDASDLAGGGRHLDDGAGLGDAGRHVGDGSEVAGAGRRADDVPAPPRTPPDPVRPRAGDTHPLQSNYQHLLDEYRDPATTAARRTRISEELGEAGALDYAQRVSGNDALPLVRPLTDADVADLVARVNDNRAWDRAIAFNGSEAVNVVYFDGQHLHIIEAKGGGGRYIDRDSVFVRPGHRIDQTDPEYPRDVAADMVDDSRADGRNAIGELIEQMYMQDRVRYVGVRTGPYYQIRKTGGSPRIVVEHVFLEPTPVDP
jgi:hypothetical protein